MPRSEYVAYVRSHIGNELLLLPAVTVLPIDDENNLLLVRDAATGTWGTIGGAVDIDESPADAARREAREEAGIVVHLDEILAAVGGPRFRAVYPNRDRVAYVITIYRATVEAGQPHADGVETCDVAWFSRSMLREVNLDPCSRAELAATAWLDD